MRRIAGLVVALMLVLGALFAPAMGASLLSKSGRSTASASDTSSKKSQKKKCKKLKKKIKKAKTKKAKKRAKKKYNKKCKCKKLKKKAKKAKSAKKRKRAKKQYQKKCTGGGGSGGGGSGGGNPSSGKTERNAEGTYASPVVGIAGIGYLCGMGCVEFPVTETEAYVSVEVIDDSGLPAGAALAQDTDGDGIGDIFATVCGKTDKPIPITPGLPLNVAVGAGVVVAFDIPPGGCPSVATSGTVKVTFSNLP